MMLKSKVHWARLTLDSSLGILVTTKGSFVLSKRFRPDEEFSGTVAFRAMPIAG